MFQPELYSKEMLRQGSEDSDTVEMEYCGKLHFALKFDSEMDALVVKVDTLTIKLHDTLNLSFALSRQRYLVPNYTRYLYNLNLST